LARNARRLVTAHEQPNGGDPIPFHALTQTVALGRDRTGLRGRGTVRSVPMFDVPQRFSRQWVARKVPQMESTEFHAMFHEAATRGWDEDELRQLARTVAQGSDLPT
jgi:hypothetical protein